MNDEERLEGIAEVIERLKEMSSDHVILVEGNKDVASLKNVGVEGDIFCVQSGGGPVRAAEYAWRSGKPAIILTDWDRRGGNLASLLRDNLASLGVPYDDAIRSDMAFYTRAYSKDVESLDSVIELLESHQRASP